MARNETISVDDDETELAILLLNAAIPIWNWRERDSAPPWFKTSWPVGGIEFIFDPTYKVCFRHLDSGRVYGIVAPRYEPYVTKPAMSFRRVPLDPKLVRSVERVVWRERAPSAEGNSRQSAAQHVA